MTLEKKGFKSPYLCCDVWENTSLTGFWLNPEKQENANKKNS